MMMIEQEKIKWMRRRRRRRKRNYNKQSLNTFCVWRRRWRRWCEDEDDVCVEWVWSESNLNEVVIVRVGPPQESQIISFRFR